MPKKNKTACKRRKCQRSRRLSRRHNRLRTRTIRRGGWPWTRKRPPTPTPTLMETLIEKDEFWRKKKFDSDQEKLLRKSAEKTALEAENRKLAWAEKVRHQAELELIRSNATQQRNDSVMRNNPTRTPEEGHNYRNAVSSLADRFKSEVASRETPHLRDAASR